jgi:O-antigen/teichoic acid export membrane protein
VNRSASALSEDRRKKDAALRSAIATGLAAKGTGVALQLLAIPFAIRHLGLEGFGQYATAVALFSWIALCETVVGQSMVRKLVAAIRNTDADQTTSISFTGAITVSAAAVTLGALVAGAIALWSIFSGGMEYPVGPLYIAAGCIAVLRVVVAIAGRVRSAFQQTHIDNTFSLVANLAAMVAVFIAMTYKPSPLTLLLAVSLPPLFFQMVSGWLIFSNNPLLQGQKTFLPEIARELVSEGKWISLAQIGTILERQVPLVIFALASAPALAGQYAIAMQLLLMAAGPVIMITVPLMPAVADSMHSGDNAWWSKRIDLLIKAILFVGITGIASALVIGPATLSLVFGVDHLFTPASCGFLAAWITAIVAANCYYCVLMAVGQVSHLGVQLLAQGILFVLLGAPTFIMGGLTSVFALGLILTTICTLLPWKQQAKILANQHFGAGNPVRV